MFSSLLFVSLLAQWAEPSSSPMQLPSSQGAITGRLTGADRDSFSRLRVLITSVGGRTIHAETHVDPTGGFDIPFLGSGVFELQIVALDGSPVHQQAITLPFMGSLVVDLKRSQSANPRPPISVARLQHKTNKQAARKYKDAQVAAARSDHHAAIRLLNEALVLDPEFYEALNNLGVAHTRLEDWDAAREAFARAISLDGTDPIAEANLAYVELRRGAFASAESAARASLRADAVSPRAHLYLALSLLNQNKARNEAISHLTRVQDEMPDARRLLEKLNQP